MKLTEWSETWAFNIQTPGKYPEDNIPQQRPSLTLCAIKRPTPYKFWDDTWGKNFSLYIELNMVLIHVSRYSDWLWAGRSGDRIPVGLRFSAPIQSGPGAHPAFCTMNTVSLLGVKCYWPLAPFWCRGHRRVELYLYPPSGPHWACNRVTLPLP
jgi:hypothetical protein